MVYGAGSRVGEWAITDTGLVLVVLGVGWAAALDISVVSCSSSTALSISHGVRDFLCDSYICKLHDHMAT